jgi:hypothetical protein
MLQTGQFSRLKNRPVIENDADDSEGEEDDLPGNNRKTPYSGKILIEWT